MVVVDVDSTDREPDLARLYDPASVPSRKRVDDL